MSLSLLTVETVKQLLLAHRPLAQIWMCNARKIYAIVVTVTFNPSYICIVECYKFHDIYIQSLLLRLENL